MNNVKEIEIDGLKPSELNHITKSNWVPFLAFLVLMAVVVGFLVKFVFVASDVAGKVMPRLEYGSEGQ